MTRRVGIVGVGQTKYKNYYADHTYPELVQVVVSRALEDSGLTMHDIDAIVFAMAPDSMIGVCHPERWCVDYIGARGKPFMRINTGGSTGMTAVLTAFYHITSGLFDTVLVAGAERTGECGETQKILGKIWDPLYERDVCMNTITMLAQSAVRYMHQYGLTEEQMAMVVVKNRRNGMNNPNAHLQKIVSIKDVLDSKVLSWPIKLFDSCPSSSGACSVILCSEEKAKKVAVPPAWIKGVGNLLETYWVGDRMGPAAKWDHADAGALAGACQAAYKMAGISNPYKEIDVAELYAPFSSTEFHTIEAARFCEKGKAAKLIEKGVFEMDGDLPVSPSGGLICTHPIAVTGMFLIAEAALQVQHRAGARQVENAEVALATANGGDHEIFGAFVLSRKK